MIFKHLNVTIFLLLLGLVITSSCKKENSVTLVKTETPFETQFYMSISGEEIETNAVAAICENDTMSFFIISNKEELLDYLTEQVTFESGDFVYYRVEYPTYAYSQGVHALGEEITGPIPNVTLTIGSTDANIEIASNDGNIISGSSEGLMLALDPTTNLPVFFESYSMEFNALIVKESSYCPQ